MFTCRFYIFCLVAILYIGSCVGNSNVNKCVETDKQALLKFKAGIIDEKDILSSWNGEDCCKWERIECDSSTGHVTMLRILYGGLRDMKFPREILSYSNSEYWHIGEDYGARWFIDRAIFAWKGANREYHGKNLGLLTSIDLSYNQLIGEIPLSVTKLAALASLNLSRNNLTGFIPSNIGHMKMLESLDLSRNYLHGIIPESISNLTFLGVMNLSFNNLSGMIPISTQLETFGNSTYTGNLGLCGPPLSKGCSEDSNTNDVEGDDELISFGFYITIGLGFIIGFWGVCGTLILNNSWRYAYFHFFNNMNDWIHVQLVIFMARLKRRFQVQD